MNELLDRLKIQPRAQLDVFSIAASHARLARKYNQFAKQYPGHGWARMASDHERIVRDIANQIIGALNV